MVFASKSVYAVLMLGYLVACYVAAKLIEGSRYGYRLFAVRDDEDAASAAGINPLRMRSERDVHQRLHHRDRRLAVRAVFPLSRSDPRDLAGAVVPVRAAAGAGRARQRDRPGARLVRDHAAVGAPALASRPCRARPASRDLRRRRHHRDALFPERPGRSAGAARPQPAGSRRDERAPGSAQAQPRVRTRSGRCAR